MIGSKKESKLRFPIPNIYVRERERVCVCVCALSVLGRLAHLAPIGINASQCPFGGALIRCLAGCSVPEKGSVVVSAVLAEHHHFSRHKRGGLVVCCCRASVVVISLIINITAININNFALFYFILLCVSYILFYFVYLIFNFNIRFSQLIT